MLSTVSEPAVAFKDAELTEVIREVADDAPPSTAQQYIAQILQRNANLICQFRSSQKMTLTFRQ